MERIETLGRRLLAVAAIASGLRQLLTGSFVRLVPVVPAWMSWPAAWRWAGSLVLVGAGLAILSGYRVRTAALAIATLLLFVLAAIQLPPALGQPGTGYLWANPCKVLALLGGVLAIAGARGATAWIFLAIFLVVCGVQHFVYAGFVDTLVPAWIPPTRRFWTIFAGVALVAGGLGLAVRRIARPVALLVALMIFLWILLVHVPRAVSMRSAFELDGAVEALALTGIALLVAGLRRADRAVVAPP